MPKKEILFFAVSLGVLFSASLFLVPAKAADTTPVNGYAWSENIGWIQMKPTSFGGVFIDNSSGAFSGWAWSENIGWVDFAPASGFPSSPSYGAKLNWTSGQVSGWAKAVAGGTGGWDGWISMSGASPAYSVNLNKTTGIFSGWAWGSDVVGWVDFSKVTTSVAPPEEPTLSVTLTTDTLLGPVPLTVNLTATVTGTATGPITYKFDCDSNGTYEAVFNNVSETTKTYSCTYNSAGLNTAKVYVERGMIVVEGKVVPNSEENTVSITVLDIEINNEGSESKLIETLTATVAGVGVATGPFTYTFDCGNGIVKEIVSSELTMTYNCEYTSPDQYTATVSVSVQDEKGEKVELSKEIKLIIMPYFELISDNNMQATIIEGKIASGSKLDTFIEVKRYYGFNKDINLLVSSSSSDLPKDATYNFSDSRLSPSEYSIGSKFSVNLLSPEKAVPGTYTYTIGAVGESPTKKVTLNIDSISTMEIWEF